MNPPRLVIAVIGHIEFDSRLEEVGHTILQVSDPSQVAGAGIVLIGTSADELPQAIDAIVPFVRDKQVIGHTCPRYGLEAFDPLHEVAQVSTFVALNAADDAWSITGDDPAAEVVGNVLLGECGLRVIPVAPEHLKEFVAGMAFAAFRNQIEIIGFELLESAGVPQELQQFIMHTAAGSLSLVDVATLEHSVNAIADPADRETFCHLARRTAQAYRAHDVEWWALERGQEPALDEED